MKFFFLNKFIGQMGKNGKRNPEFVEKLIKTIYIKYKVLKPTALTSVVASVNFFEGISNC